MGTSGDKIVLLDGMGSGSGSATNGLLSMIPGMFANLIGGNKMDPNLVAALMNGRNNQDGFGGANGWWLWIIVLFWLWGGRSSKPLTRCLTPTDPREDGRWRTLSRCSINAGPRNLITPLGEISNICSLCSIAITFLRYWIATRK